RVGSSVVVDHAVCIAMVRDDDDRIIILQRRLSYFACTEVNSFTCLYSGFKNASMPHHIGVCKIQANEIRLSFFKLRNYLVLDVAGAHFWFKVVRGHLRRRAKNACLTLERFLSSAGEK